MKKDRKLYPYIEDFGKAVYGEYAHLAFASFNEESFIKDATEKITILQVEAAEMREVFKTAKGFSLAFQTYALSTTIAPDNPIWKAWESLDIALHNLIAVGKENP